MRALIALLLVPSAALAQQDRQLRALPTIVEQRNNALDGVAICQGDVAALQAQIATLQKQVTDLQKPKDETQEKPQ